MEVCSNAQVEPKVQILQSGERHLQFLWLFFCPKYSKCSNIKESIYSSIQTSKIIRIGINQGKLTLGQLKSLSRLEDSLGSQLRCLMRFFSLIYFSIFIQNTTSLGLCFWRKKLNKCQKCPWQVPIRSDHQLETYSDMNSTNRALIWTHTLTINCKCCHSGPPGTKLQKIADRRKLPGNLNATSAQVSTTQQFLVSIEVGVTHCPELHPYIVAWKNGATPQPCWCIFPSHSLAIHEKSIYI